MMMFLERNLKSRHFSERFTSNMEQKPDHFLSSMSRLSAENEPTGNQKSFQSWLKLTNDDRPQFATFIDGDLVESANNFSVLAINASLFKSQRGKGAQMDIFDSKSKKNIPF